MGSTYTELKARQRKGRDSYPENPSLRAHRAIVVLFDIPYVFSRFWDHFSRIYTLRKQIMYGGRSRRPRPDPLLHGDSGGPGVGGD